MKAGKPLVTIMISVYNQLYCLERAVKSAMNQDYDNLEIIIGDDCSNDGDVKALVESYQDPRIKYFRNEKNLGIQGNYRALLYKHAAGDLATMLNADDYLADDNYITKAVHIFNENKDVKLVFGRTQVYLMFEEKMSEDSRILELPELMDGNWLFINQLRGYVIPHVTSVYDRKEAMRIDFYNTSHISDDWDSLLRLIQGNRVGFVRTVSGVFGRHDNNVSKTINLDTVFTNDEYIQNTSDWAIELKQINQATIVDWRKKMLYRYYVKNYIKVSLWEPENRQLFLERLQDQRKFIYKKLRRDPRIFGFNLIKNKPKLLDFVFSKYLKQESVIADFLQYSKTNKQ